MSLYIFQEKQKLLMIFGEDARWRLQPDQNKIEQES